MSAIQAGKTTVRFHDTNDTPVGEYIERYVCI